MKRFVIAAAIAFLPALPACAESPQTAPVASNDGKLYAAFGGHDGVVRIVDDLFVNVDADPRIASFFDPAKRTHTKAMLVEQFCRVLGGGCAYTGEDMKKAHKDLGIQTRDFNALVEDLQKAMDKNHIPFAAQNRFLAALAPQHRDVVTPPSN